MPNRMPESQVRILLLCTLALILFCMLCLLPGCARSAAEQPTEPSASAEPTEEAT